jgi:Ca2+/H+ antiporter, TMEM165/GDT1 family
VNAPFEAFFNSTLMVAIGEIGDKTNILALMLAARYKKTTPIIMGILVATIANHLLAAFVGNFIAGLAIAAYLPWVLSVSFIALGLWVLIPDKVDEDEATPKKDYGPFLTTVVAFFLAEMGDKTQIATVALAAQYHNIIMVIAGSTLGLMLANVPVIFFGEKILARISMKWVHRAAAVIFIGFGLFGLIGLLMKS